MINGRIGLKKIELGTCYYPEHWDRAMWREDLSRMLEHGIHTVRVAEFAWNLMEKTEGIYDFSLWDAFLDLCDEVGMNVIFCTPTATPPAWLTEKYPEVLNRDATGHTYYHGLRRQHNLTSPVYLSFCREITRACGERYGNRKCIVGWQLDNEVNCEVNRYYADSDHEAFRAYLKKKFGSLDELNDKMGTVVWNQTYTEWEQVHLLRNTTQGSDHGNPHMELEERRFISESAIAFLKLQIDILRPLIGERFITTNGLFGHLDYQKLMDAGLDFICFDNYPNFNYDVNRADDGMRDRWSTLNLAGVRSISPAFGIMEEQSGPGGWTFRMLQASPRPGQMKLWSWQCVANGADYVSYFRWRTAPVGTEIYWHGILDQDNRDNRRLRELDEFRRETDRLNEQVPDFAGSDFEAQAAILTDYDNTWDGEGDMWHGPLTRVSRDALFTAMAKLHVPVDLKDIRDTTTADELLKYRVLFYPHAAIMTRARAEVLRQYVERGGTLVVGARTGYKDIYGRCPMMAKPGYLSELCGCTVDDFTPLGVQDGEIRMELCGESVPAPEFADILTPTDGEAIGTFANGWFAGSVSAVEKKTGEGRAIYIGSAFSEDMACALLRRIGIESVCGDLVGAPEAVELEKRGNVLFILNPQMYPVSLTFRKPCEDILSGEALNGRHMIAPFGVYAVRTE